MRAGTSDGIALMKTSLIALGTVLSLTAPAYAEGADPAEGSADSTILVVGQQDTPITVVPRGLSVSLGQEEFDAVNALNVEDLMKYAPNFFGDVDPARFCPKYQFYGVGRAGRLTGSVTHAGSWLN